jgi:transcriptional regulator GlxA family with amidase domain
LAENEDISSLMPKAVVAYFAFVRAEKSTRSRRTKRIVFLVMPGSHSLELAGPFDAFATAERNASQKGLATGYQLEIASLEAGTLAAFGGLKLLVDQAYRSVRRAGIDTLVVVAGPSSATQSSPLGLLKWLRQGAKSIRRIASVCTGAYVLAEAGLLNGRKVTTHWAFGAAFAERFPDVEVDTDRIFSRDGHVYTSAGVTAGIDLALALIEEDMGRELAISVARSLVVYLRRPGTQNQFSIHLRLQAAEREPLRELQAWMPDHLNEDMSVEALADRAGMSPRNFARVFQRETHLTPAKYVERIRLDAARTRLEEGTSGIKQIALDTGFGNLEALRRSFQRYLNISLGDYRDRFRSTLIQ